MAAVRFQGPCARRAPSSGRSAGGGGTSSGPQHALHSVRWPCWGSLRGPSWAWTTSGGRGRAGSPAAPRAGRPALSPAGQQREGQGHLAGCARCLLPYMRCEGLVLHTPTGDKPRAHGALVPSRWGGLLSAQGLTVFQVGDGLFSLA